MFKFYTLYLAVVLSLSLHADNPEELGRVNWLRDLSEAQSLSKSQAKPIFILFQEIPGCLTCRNYGNIVLSHPLIVETIETYFVPLAIYNNRRGKDESVLKYYSEPSWNNPVVRIVNSDKSDILPRLNGNYTPSGLVKHMIACLKKINQDVPSYLLLLAKELTANERGLEKTTLSMFCFWTGEKELGKIDGVFKTEAGFMNHDEVVNVYYDPEIVELESILKEGQKTNCADGAYYQDKQEKDEASKILAANKLRPISRFKPDQEPKYYLTQTVYKDVPMSPAQAVKINALIGYSKSPDFLLSPRQLQMLEYLKKFGKATWASSIDDKQWQSKFYRAWEAVEKKV
ncbi:MAG: hypothetical protein HKN76_23055 [Saprospiraceae bacterium]|nr:hypothetical protein [Saprospiraceae bacterium]